LETSKLAEEICKTITQTVVLYLALKTVFSNAKIVLTKLGKKGLGSLVHTPDGT